MTDEKTITVVDDDPSVRKALSRMIRAAGYQADVYASAEEFLASNPSHADCLILDVHLPGMSGLQLQSDLNRAGSACPIVFISAFANEEAKQQALSGGAASFLPKPLESEQLLDLLDELLAG